MRRKTGLAEQKELDEIVRRIVEVAQPEKIILGRIVKREIAR